MTRYLLPPIAATLILAAIAAFSVGLQQTFLAPSLGAAAFSQVLHPGEKSAAPYNLGVGQLIGGVSGFCGVIVAGQSQAYPLIGTHDLPAGRIVAVAIAVCLAVIGQMAAGARTPTGGATALVVALGVDTPTLNGAIRLMAGIALVMGLGEVARRAILKIETGERDGKARGPFSSQKQEVEGSSKTAS